MEFFPNLNKQQEDPEEIRKRAEQAQMEYEKYTGVKVPEEEGAESEGFTDIVKPYKQAALQKLKEQGVPAAALAIGSLALPDSPLDIIPSAGKAAEAAGAAGRGLKALHLGEEGAKVAEEANALAKAEKALDYSKMRSPAEIASAAKRAKTKAIGLKYKRGGLDVEEIPGE